MKKFLTILYILSSFVFILSVSPTTTESASCKVIASFDPAGEMKDTWYKEDSTAVDIVFNTTNCIGQTIYLTVYEEDFPLQDDALSDSNLDDLKILVTDDNFKFPLKLGEEGCEFGPGFDCHLYLIVEDKDGTNYYKSWREKNGDLFYECDADCLSNAKLITNSSTTSGSSSGNAVGVGITKESINLSQGVYKLLAPIGKLTSINTSSNGTCPGNPDITNGVACYLNIIFKIGIGLAGALAVVMIVVASIQYMGDESVFGKTEAKGKIFSAILGLIIALAAYAILNTVNPDLTGSGGVTIDDVSFEIDGEPMISDDLVPSGAKTTKCPEGIDSGNKPPSCKTITQKVQAMLSKARTEGYNITGYGFRSKQRQEKLRSDNCGASNIYNKNATCQPPTALPGTSMHESGLAFDLQCDGKSIRTKDNRCFLWLKSNASKYGLYNLSSEPWHWSTTGH